MKIEEVLHYLQKSKRGIVTLSDLKKLLGIRLDNTAYKMAEKLVRKGFLSRLKKGIYSFLFSSPHDFEIANALWTPSYISLETALSFYGILPSFPYVITSVTPRKTKRFEILQKEFEYVHIQKALFFGYTKEKNFLLAEPEKALIDEIYLVAKGWRRIERDELDLSKLDRRSLKKIAGGIEYLPFRKKWKELKL